jgi:predicted secreted hydrolase
LTRYHSILPGHKELLLKGLPTLFLVVSIILLSGCDISKQPTQNSSMTLAEAMGSEVSGNYQRAHKERKFNFPRDHGAHPGFRQEWWYLSGNVQSLEGHRFGYELTFFRVALNSREDLVGSSGPKVKTSSWRANNIYMAHFAVTDIDNNKFYYAEKFSRDALGLAGAGVFFKERIEGDSTQLKVWLDDWSVESVGNSIFPIQLLANSDDFSISLELDKTKPIVLQGENGLSIKGNKPGNASYYYSVSRMVTTGSITVNDEKSSISGYSWLDREWSTSQLEPEQAGWDWFALQLDDNREIMFYSLRKKDGSLDLHSAGMLIEEDGESHYLKVNDVSIEVLRHWRSPHSNINYPAGWKITLPSESLVLQVTPAIADQELNMTVRYWEGAVKVSGKYRNTNQIVAGKGYVELAGY